MTDTTIRPATGRRDNRITVPNAQALVDALSWVDEVYPDTNRDGAAVLNMTWEQWDALRDALTLPRQARKGMKRSA